MRHQRDSIARWPAFHLTAEKLKKAKEGTQA
jgi:hypothetical protein